MECFATPFSSSCQQVCLQVYRLNVFSHSLSKHLFKRLPITVDLCRRDLIGARGRLAPEFDMAIILGDKRRCGAAGKARGWKLYKGEACTR